MNLLIFSLLVVAYVILMATSISGAKNVVHDEVPRALPLVSGAKPRRAENWHKSEEREVVNRNKRAFKNNPGTGPSDEIATNNGAGSDLLSSVSAGGASVAGGTAGAAGAAGGAAAAVGAVGGSGAASCRYSKSAWTECDTKSNTRSRTLTLKKGDTKCDPTKTIARKCKKACRYEKGSWSECVNGQMSRTDNLKSTSDTTCKSTRSINKNCNPSKSKDKKDRKKARKGRA